MRGTMSPRRRALLPGTAPGQAFHDREGSYPVAGYEILRGHGNTAGNAAGRRPRAGMSIPGRWERACDDLAEQADRLRTRRLLADASQPSQCDTAPVVTLARSHCDGLCPYRRLVHVR